MSIVLFATLRRSLLGMTVAVSLLLPALAAAANQSIDVDLDSARADSRSKAEVTIKSSSSKVSKNVGVTGAELYLPKGALLSAENFSSCKEEKLKSGAGCPRSALVASGTAEAKTSYPALEQVTADVDLYMGEKLGELLLLVTEQQTLISFVVKGNIKAAGSEGFSYSMNFGKIPVEPLGPASEVFIYMQKISMKTVQKSAYRNPSKCKSRGWKFAVKLSYDDGSKTTSSYRVRCKN